MVSASFRPDLQGVRAALSQPGVPLDGNLTVGQVFFS